MAKVTVVSGNVTVEAEGQKELFETLAEYQEVFSVVDCGGCEEANLRYTVREVDGNKFYEIRCLNCYAKLPFGQHKGQGTLFPKNWVPL
jgi:translation initiation factor 2 beta subunit (eIF-2beta)/eIF-5